MNQGLEDSAFEVRVSFRFTAMVILEHLSGAHIHAKWRVLWRTSQVCHRDTFCVRKLLPWDELYFPNRLLAVYFLCLLCNSQAKAHRLKPVSMVEKVGSVTRIRFFGFESGILQPLECWTVLWLLQCWFILRTSVDGRTSLESGIKGRW